MIGMTNARGGGTGLNLKVVGGTTQPENPRENTIWINTDTAITGYVLSPTQPETIAEGVVWLKTADTGVEINVGKKNAVLLHLADGKLYTGGTWANVEGWVYAGGNWQQFAVVEMWLYRNGDTCDDESGGWNTKVNDSGLYVKFYASYMHIYSRGLNQGYASAWTKKAIDITGYTKLLIHTTALGTANKMLMGVVKTAYAGTTYGGFKPEAGLTITSDKSEMTHVIDVTDLSGEYFVELVAESASCRVTEVHFE